MDVKLKLELDKEYEGRCIRVYLDAAEATIKEYTEADKKVVEKNFCAKKILVYGLEPKEYDRISTHDTAKEIWEALQIAYEGTTQVKQDKSDTDDSSTMAVEGEEIGYDSMLALMAQPDNDEDNGNKVVNFRDVQKNLKSYSPKKLMNLDDVLITAFCSLAEDRDSLFLELEESEHTREDLVAAITDQKKNIEILRKEKSDLLAETADQRELIVNPLTNSKLECSERGNGIVSEEYFRLEDEVKALRYRMFAEIEKNELLQANLENEKGRGAGFPREKTPHNPHSKSATTSNNWPRTQCGNIGHFKEGVQAKNQSIPKDKAAAETGTGKGSGQQWFMNSGCSKHMTGNTTDFLSLKTLQGGSVSFGNGKKGYILGVGKFGKSLTHSIENVYYVNGFKYNLLSVSQICDKGNKSGDLSFLKAVDNDAELWHKKLGHASLSLLNKLIQKDLVHGLPMSQFKTQKVYDAYARGKHVKSSFKSKRDVSTSKPLELLHRDLCGPMRVQSRGGKRYIFVIVDDYSRFT
ncbi:uncharacterized protein [Nicotiana sylvestris]|uniref:uncharacterized protein n=1 Tax=Nicotiana sylvestris TaxID=4096 RepID=UPI00388CD523